jgi:energy-coupling factor transport system substrate-specific component
LRARARRGLLAATNLLGVAAFAWPFLVPSLVRTGRGHGPDALWIMALLVGLLGALLLAEAGRGGMGPKTVALVGALGAAMVALRLPGFVGGFSAMFVVVLVAGNSFGPGFGFVLGAVGTLASGLFVGGIGPWLPFQMVAVGWVGMGAGLLPRPHPWAARIAVLAAYGAVAAFAFGAVMNLWFWPFAAGTSPLAWDPQGATADNLRRYALFYTTTSAGWDALGAMGNAAAVAVLGRPLLGTLDRAALRMNLELGAKLPELRARAS